MLFHKQLDYDAIKVFGCLVFAVNVKPHKDKLSLRATACVFLGFQSGTKGFKVYDLSSKKLFLTRGITYHERNFPFIDSTFETKSVLPPLPLPLVSDLQDDPTTDPNITDHTTNSPQVATGSYSSGDAPLPLRHSTINKNPPVWFSYFVTNTIIDTTALKLHVHTISNNHVSFLAKLCYIKEPHSYEVACKSLCWVQAM